MNPSSASSQPADWMTVAKKYPMWTNEFVSANPELHHYTSFNGLKGIYENNCLWATHFSHLNDSAELLYLRAPLSSNLINRTYDLLRARQRESYKLRRHISQLGGVEKVSRDLANDLVDALYSTTFSPSGSNTEAPYIASFCSHFPRPGEQITDGSYERENGLLSQWRGYGKNGGYAIVFDTAALAEMVGQELRAHYWIYMVLSPVHYGSDINTPSVFMGNLLNSCAQSLLNMLEHELPLEEITHDFIRAATLTKHQGFKEEREVRIVACTGSKSTQDAVIQAMRHLSPLPIKAVRNRVQEEKNKDYVALFEDLKQALPIKRIIVGPSEQQKENYEKAKSLISASIPLTMSETPFIG
jgi:hypothetical protein